MGSPTLPPSFWVQRSAREERDQGAVVDGVIRIAVARSELRGAGVEGGDDWLGLALWAEGVISELVELRF